RLDAPSEKPCSQALRYQAAASLPSLATPPRPNAYMRPRFTSARGTPTAAAFLNHSTASASSCGTPRPFLYINPRLTCASELPNSAALRYHMAASFASLGTPRPVSYIRASATWAVSDP